MAKKVEKKASKSLSKPKLGVPVGVKIISVLYYIAAVVLIILGIALFGGAGLVGYLASKIPFIAVLGSGIIAVAGIIVILLAVLSFFIARGLWKGKQWARIIVIIFAILGFISAIISLLKLDFSVIGSLVINGLIGGYLLFSENVKKAFV